MLWGEAVLYLQQLGCDSLDKTSPLIFVRFLNTVADLLVGRTHDSDQNVEHDDLNHDRGDHESYHHEVVYQVVVKFCLEFSQAQHVGVGDTEFTA
jgi:hypothetical protein